MAEWTSVLSEKNRTSYIDFATLKKTGGFVKVWGMDEFKTPEKFGKDNVSSLSTQYEFNCKERSTRIIAGYSYNEIGEVEDFFLQPTDWLPIPPGSRADIIMSKVCDDAD
jgi:hypothetical protein